MTAFAFILGVVPLMKANGAGAGAQNVMGTAVFWGMLVATFMGVFIIPGNFTFIESLGRRRKHKADGPEEIREQPPSVVEEEANGFDATAGSEITSDLAVVKPVGGDGETSTAFTNVQEKKKNESAATIADKGQKL